jgi:hypothetical protein
MNEFDSLEVTELRKLIDNKKEYLAQIEDGKRYFYLQREINLLENKILPILLANSVPIQCEIAKEAVACFDKLLNEPDATEYNGMVLYFHFNDAPHRNGNIEFYRVAQFSTIEDCSATPTFINGFMALPKILSHGK